MRAIIAGLLVVVGGLISIPASVAAWQDRAILDEDNFVATVDEAFEQEEVQTAIAERLTDEIMEYAQIQERIASGLATIQEEGGEDLPEGLVLLSGPLTGAARDAIFRVTLRLIEAQPLEDVREGALRASHRVLTAIINDDVEALKVVGENVVLDLGVILEEIVKDVGGEDGEGFLADIDIPEDAGQIVLTQKSDNSAAWAVAEWLRISNPWVPLAAALVFALAVVVSPHRRRTVIAVGLTIVVAAVITILVVTEPLKEVATDALAETSSGKAAAGATYDIIVRSFHRQQAVIGLIGVGLAAGGALAGDRYLTAGIRSRLRRTAPGAAEAFNLTRWVRDRGLALRVGGLGAAALFLIMWPDPSTRLIVTVFVLAALYLAALAVAASDAAWAVSARSWLAQLWERYFRVPEVPASDRATRGRSPLHWVAARAPWFRGIGIVLGVILLLAWPSLTFGTVVVVVALALLYLAAIDMIVGRAAERDGGTND
jgi:hypothetical protein